MEVADIPAVGRLFKKTFRNDDSEPGDELKKYLEILLFGSPYYSPEHGSLVYADENNRICSAYLAVPMPFVAHGRPVVSRLVCAFMADGKAGVTGAMRLTLKTRARHQDLCFTDNASPVSANHFEAGGGMILPMQSLEWRRVFWPLVSGATFLEPHFSLGASPIVKAPLKLVDRALRKMKPGMRPTPPSGYKAKSAELGEFFHHAATMTERFAVRPVWSKEYVTWLISTAMLNKRLGVLKYQTVHDSSDRTIGAFVYFSQNGGLARVLNVVCNQGSEMEVCALMFSYFDSEGYVAAVGMAQPFLMNAVMRQRWLSFRHRGYFCLATRHADVQESALGDDIYIGGLASENWSRLLTDF